MDAEARRRGETMSEAMRLARARAAELVAEWDARAIMDMIRGQANVLARETLKVLLTETLRDGYELRGAVNDYLNEPGVETMATLVRCIGRRCGVCDAILSEAPHDCMALSLAMTDARRRTKKKK